MQFIGGMASPRLLIVEDENLLRRCLARFFVRRGFDVVEATCLAEAEQQLEAMAKALLANPVIETFEVRILTESQDA